MEALIMAVGAKTCCVIASGCGGLTNWAVQKRISWKDLALACLVGWIAAEFFIPPIMSRQSNCLPLVNSHAIFLYVFRCYMQGIFTPLALS